MMKRKGFEARDMIQLQGFFMLDHEEEVGAADEEFNPSKEEDVEDARDVWARLGAVVVDSRATVARFKKETREQEQKKLLALQSVFSHDGIRKSGAATPSSSHRSAATPSAAPSPMPRLVEKSPRRASIIDLDFEPKSLAGTTKGCQLLFFFFCFACN
jgi:hypothetical protein